MSTPARVVRQLRALLIVLEAGTSTGADDELGTSQASVSRTVAAPGRALGATVLARPTRELRKPIDDQYARSRAGGR